MGVGAYVCVFVHVLREEGDHEELCRPWEQLFILFKG